MFANGSEAVAELLVANVRDNLPISEREQKITTTPPLIDRSARFAPKGISDVVSHHRRRLLF